jgi:BTB/POZ domain-containing protein 8
MELTSTNAINSATTNNIAFNNSHFTNQSNNMCDCIESVDFSCTSSTSCTSSRSNIEDSADDSSIGNRQRLGEDLLKMFLQEIATDVAIEVGGRKMRAHKCILRSRCQYFAAILAGNWLNNSGNIISLPVEYSFATVHFALCHIYSGASHPPEGISLMELASLSDLLGLEGLKEVTAYSLKINYCHNFHKVRI